VYVWFILVVLDHLFLLYLCLYGWFTGGYIFILNYFITLNVILHCLFLHRFFHPIWHLAICYIKHDLWQTISVVDKNVGEFFFGCGEFVSLVMIVSSYSVWISPNLATFFSFRILTKPPGNISFYDPAEIHNRNNLKKYSQESIVKLVYHIIGFFIFLYR